MRKTERRTWTILLGLALGVCVSNGFARFAYGLILPAMRDDLGWTYAQAGWINTANALGYVLGAVLTFLLISRAGSARLFAIGMLATSFFLLLSGLTRDFWWLTVWRILTGVFGAPVFISGGAMAATLFVNDPKRNALAIALYFGGGGLGMIVSGAALPVLFELGGTATWPTSWVLLGVASLVCCPLCVWAVTQISTTGPDVLQRASLPLVAMRFELVGYGLFATGYIVYLTFLGAWMRELSAGPKVVSGVWIVVGIAIVLSPFLWKPVLAQFNSGVPLAAATGVVALGTLLPIILPTTQGLRRGVRSCGVRRAERGDRLLPQEPAAAELGTSRRSLHRRIRDRPDNRSDRSRRDRRHVRGHPVRLRCRRPCPSCRSGDCRGTKISG